MIPWPRLQPGRTRGLEGVGVLALQGWIDPIAATATPANSLAVEDGQMAAPTGAGAAGPAVETAP